MTTPKEINQFKDLLERGFDQDRAKRLIIKARAGIPEPKEGLAQKSLSKTPEELLGVDSFQKEQEIDGPETIKKPETLDILENQVSDTVTQFGRDIQEEAKSKITPATGAEIPFTEQSKLAENFVPSAEKAFGGVVEFLGSPIESLENFGNTLKAVVLKGAETSPILGRFIESSEGDKLIQEALSEGAEKIKTKVSEKGIVKTVNEAFQEDPALAATIFTSLFKKIGRVGGISKKDELKIDALGKQSEQQIEQFLKPTKIDTKQITKQITPKIQARLKSGQLKPGDREAIKEITDANVESVGKEIGDFIKAGKVKGEIDFDKMVDVLAKEDAKLRLDGNIIPGNEASVKFINAQLDFLQQLEKAYGKNLPAAKQLELRQKYDIVFDKTVTRDKITKFQDELQVKLADSLRAELAKNNPDLAELNKEFSFNIGLKKVLDETLDRTTGQDPVGLISELRGATQGTAGATVGGIIGGTVAGPIGAAIGAVLGGATGLKLTKVLASPKYKLVSAKKKGELADAIAENNPGKVEKILDSIILSEGITAIPEEE